MPDGTFLPETEARWTREDIGEEAETSEVARESGPDSGDASSTAACETPSSLAAPYPVVGG